MSELSWKSEGHKRRFEEAIQEIGRVYQSGKIDPEYGAALFILTSHSGQWEQAKGYVTHSAINMEDLLDQPLSSGESIMLQLASNLFNGNAHIDPLEFMRLDEANFELALSAIRLRRDGLHMSELEAQ